MTGKPGAALRRLSALSYAQGFTLWHYNTRLPYTVGPFRGIDNSPATNYPAQTLAECLTPGFFHPFAGTGFFQPFAGYGREHMLSPGDMIAISASDGAALVWVEQTAPVVVVVAMGSTGLRGPIGKQQESKP